MLEGQTANCTAPFAAGGRFGVIVYNTSLNAGLKSDCEEGKELFEAGKGVYTEIKKADGDSSSSDSSKNSDSSSSDLTNFCLKSCSAWSECGGDYKECYAGQCIPENWDKKPSDGSKPSDTDLNNLCAKP